MFIYFPFGSWVRFENGTCHSDYFDGQWQIEPTSASFKLAHTEYARLPAGKIMNQINRRDRIKL